MATKRTRPVDALSIVGFTCALLLLGPLAWTFGVLSRRNLRRDVLLGGRGMANFAFYAGVFETVIEVFVGATILVLYLTGVI